jgi:DNA-binding transcriptional ArsR family regulator
MTSNKVFKALADPTRRRVLELLRQGSMTAGELSDQFPVSKPTMSAHFSVLQEAGLVEAEKDGRVVFYRLKMSVLEDALLGFAEALGIDATTQRGRRSKRTQQALRKSEAAKPGS